MPVDDRLLDLLETLKRREAQGFSVDFAAVCAAHPELRQELERLYRVENEIERFLHTLDIPVTTAPAMGRPDGASTGQRFWLPEIEGYEVKSLIATGGMGAVYRAVDVRLGREVALKVIRPEKLSGELLARFQMEARAVAAMDHPLIVKVYEVGEYTTEEGGIAPYLAMEYVAGGTLEAVRGPMTPAEAARVVHLLARAMAHAHARGVVHRDLKLSNVLLAPCGDEPSLNAAIGQPKVTDFGLARQEGVNKNRTQSGMVLGTPAYMAPEQAEGKAAGPAADVYALGVILYRLLSGRLPFDSPSMTELLYQITHAPPPPLEGVPAALAAICEECLAKAPAPRPSAAELARWLDAFVVGEGVTVALPLAGSPPARERLAVSLGVAVVMGFVLLGMWGLWVAMKPATPAPLTGELVVRVWAPQRGVRGQKIGIDDDAVPVREDEQVQAEVKLSEPAYAFLIVVDGKGGVTPLYPWNAGNKITVDSVAEVPPARKAATFRSPQVAQKGWHVDDTVGLDTFLLLARREPWPADRSLADLIGEVPGAPLRDPREVVVRGWNRGQKIEAVSLDLWRRVKHEASEIDDQLQQVVGRLSAEFEVVRAVQFAHVAKGR